jgi:hypothetical protein
MTSRRRGGRPKAAKHVPLRVRNTRALPERATATATNLRILTTALRALFADENFVTLLEAEALTEIPVWLKPIFEQGRQENEISK